MIARTAPFPWIILAAWAVLAAAPWINRLLERPPQRPQPPPAPRAEITRPGRDLTRREEQP